MEYVANITSLKDRLKMLLGNFDIEFTSVVVKAKNKEEARKIIKKWFPHHWISKINIYYPGYWGRNYKKI